MCFITTIREITEQNSVSWIQAQMQIINKPRLIDSYSRYAIEDTEMIKVIGAYTGFYLGIVLIPTDIIQYFHWYSRRV